MRGGIRKYLYTFPPNCELPAVWWLVRHSMENRLKTKGDDVYQYCEDNTVQDVSSLVAGVTYHVLICEIGNSFCGCDRKISFLFTSICFRLRQNVQSCVLCLTILYEISISNERLPGRFKRPRLRRLIGKCIHERIPKIQCWKEIKNLWVALGFHPHSNRRKQVSPSVRHWEAAKERCEVYGGWW